MSMTHSEAGPKELQQLHSCGVYSYGVYSYGTQRGGAEGTAAARERSERATIARWLRAAARPLAGWAP